MNNLKFISLLILALLLSSCGSEKDIGFPPYPDSQLYEEKRMFNMTQYIFLTKASARNVYSFYERELGAADNVKNDGDHDFYNYKNYQGKSLSISAQPQPENDLTAIIILKSLPV